jgi:hypothetical protein
MKRAIKREFMWCHSNILHVLTLSVFLILATVCINWPGVLSADEKKLPDAEIILDRFVEATGGLKAYNRIKNRVTESTFEISQMGIKAQITSCHAKPNLIYVRMVSDQMGTIESGSNGDVAWEKSMMMGSKIKEGDERDDALRDALFDPQAYWRDVYRKVTCVGIETVEGKLCYKVIMTPKIGNPQTLYFDKESHLLIKVEWIATLQMGTIPVEVFLGDYHEVDGISIPHRAKVKLMGQERLMTTTRVEHNVKLPEGIFKLPEEIQALMDTSKKEHGKGASQ